MNDNDERPVGEIAVSLLSRITSPSHSRTIGLGC